MALTIVVRSGDSDSPPSITFDAPRIVIGRGESCEVRLPDPSVSHRHASIRQRGSDYLVVDEGSTNGTFVGTVRLSPQASRILKSGDKLRMGRVWLEVRMEHAPPSPKPNLATKEIALGLVASALKAQGQDAQLLVRVIRGPDRGLELELESFDKQYVIGRGLGAELQVSDADASRRHVRLERRGDRVHVTDLGSKNGSVLDGEVIAQKQAVAWKPGQVLEVGANHLSYEDPVVGALLELEAAPDEDLDAFEDVEPPGETDAPHDVPLSSAAAEPAALPSKLDASPAVRKKPGPRSVATTDLMVAAFALSVLVLSLLGLFWLFRSP